MAKTVSVPIDKQGSRRTLAAPTKIGIADISGFSGLQDDARYTQFRYTRASPTVLRKMHGHELPMLIDGGSGICVMSEEVARELIIRWKSADQKMITANGNQSDLSKVAECMPINVHGIVIPEPILLAKFGSEWIILGCPCETYAWKCERNRKDGSCEITISAVDGSEQVTFFATFQGDKRDGFASSSRNFYA